MFSSCPLQSFLFALQHRLIEGHVQFSSLNVLSRRGSPVMQNTALTCHRIGPLGRFGLEVCLYVYIRSYHTSVVNVYARCYIYWSRTELFISCVCSTCSISLTERIYRTLSKIFITWVGGVPPQNLQNYKSGCPYSSSGTTWSCGLRPYY